MKITPFLVWKQRHSMAKKANIQAEWDSLHLSQFHTDGHYTNRDSYWILMVLFCRTHLQNGSYIHTSLSLAKCDMIKKSVHTLNILAIYMHISNVCVCNKYLLNEYECIYTNIHDATWTHTFNLTNACCILAEYKLGLFIFSNGNTHNSFLFPRNNIEGESRYVHHYSDGVSQSVVSGPAGLAPLGDLLEMRFFFNPPKMSWIRTW